MDPNNIDIKDKKIVNETEINNTQGIMYDVCGDDDEKLTSLPNANDILDEIIKLLECMNTDEMKVLRESNPNVFEQVLEDKFPDFSYNYYSVFKMILSGDDITPLFTMLEMMSEVNAGQSNVEDCEKGVGKYLSKFLPDGLIEKLESGQISTDDIHASGGKKTKTKNKNKNKNKNKGRH